MTSFPIALTEEFGSGYYIAHLVASVIDQDDTGDWKGEVLSALAAEADRFGVDTVETNCGRQFVRSGCVYGWKETNKKHNGIWHIELRNSS